MPRRKAESVTRIFYLDTPKGEVEVTVKSPAGAVRLQSTHDSLSITTGSAEECAFASAGSKSATVQPAGAPVPPGTTNGPEGWTPELRAAQMRLGADPLRQGGTVTREKKPYSTADAFRDLTDDNGKRVFDDDAGEGLTPEALIAAAGGDTVI